MMSVGRRLALSLVPAIVGLVAAVGLAYYGEYQRQAPEWFVAVALVSGLGSLVVAWIVTRQVARRIARLADWHNTRESAIQRAARALHDDGIIVAPPASNADELDTMEAIVDRLTSAYATLRRQHREIAARSDAQRATWDRLANEAADAVVARLEDVRLPLHIRSRITSENSTKTRRRCSAPPVTPPSWPTRWHSASATWHGSTSACSSSARTSCDSPT
jgi:hypothetical protein